MKRIGKHVTCCTASTEVRAGRRRTVWMVPDLVNEKLTYVCADAGCMAKLHAVDLNCLKLPKF